MSRRVSLCPPPSLSLSIFICFQSLFQKVQVRLSWVCIRCTMPMINTKPECLLNRKLMQLSCVAYNFSLWLDFLWPNEIRDWTAICVCRCLCLWRYHSFQLANSLQSSGFTMLNFIRSFVTLRSFGGLPVPKLFLCCSCFSVHFSLSNVIVFEQSTQLLFPIGDTSITQPGIYVWKCTQSAVCRLNLISYFYSLSFILLS